MSKYEKLYIDLKDKGFDKSYLVSNYELYLAIYQKINLSKTDIQIFQHICWKYDKCQNPAPVYLTYKDFATLFCCDKMTVYNSIKVLIKNKLILKVGDRKGRAKTGYIPNVEYLHNVLFEYLRYLEQQNIRL